MKIKSWAVVFLCVAAFAIGCKPSAEQSTAQQLDKVNTETKAAALEVQDYTYAQKDKFVETMQAQLAAIKKDLDQIATKIETSSEPARAEAKPKLQALREQVARLNKQLEGTKNATESTWDSVKAGFTKGYSELNDGFQQARQWVSEKIAP